MDDDAATDEFTVVVALANPRTERALASIAGAVAGHHGGRVLAVHVITVPNQTPLAAAREYRARIDDISEDLLAAARADAEAFGVAVETKTVLSHRGLGEVYDAAASNDADAVVMGYGGAVFLGGRAEGITDELTANLPCDLLVFDGETLDGSEVLVPTAGGYSAELSAEVAVALRDTIDADVSLLYVADDETEGRTFLSSWADEHGLGDAEIRIESGDVEAAIERHGRAASLVVIGATDRGLLTRAVRGSSTFGVIENLETPVLMAERPSKRSLWRRLFGRR